MLIQTIIVNEEINNFQNFEIKSNILYFFSKNTGDLININNHIISYDYGEGALE